MERMILASSNEGSLVLDPFLGSGTTLRVCQQLNRVGVGIELNPDYVKMSQERLQKEFVGFDSIDPRMERVPLDLRNESIRKAYLENHKHWFLRGHENALSDFEKSVESLYPDKPKEPTQLTLLEQKEQYKNPIKLYKLGRLSSLSPRYANISS